jgi:tetratricopeptide (TPR) repeat protein
MTLRTPLFLALLAAAATLLSGCASPDTRPYIGAFEQNPELRELFRLFGQERDEEKRFVLVQQIAVNLANAGRTDREILFLTTHVEKNPADIFNAYYLSLVADAYKELKAVPFAVHYYRRILNNHADLLVRGRSVHLYCLQELISLDTSPANRISYYKELISRFSDQVEHLGSAYFSMARSYEELGEWEQAIQSYQRYLDYPDPEIPGVANATRIAAEKVLFFYSAKDWLLPDLNDLVAGVREAIVTKNLARLNKLKARVNFFAEGWDQQAPSGDALPGEATEFNIAGYLFSSNVHIDPGLAPFSTDQDAYLKTTNWNFRPPTWFMYFRKVDFPANPDVNGQWEWAGIYFGEKL